MLRQMKTLPAAQCQVPETWGDDCREWDGRERKPRSPFSPRPEGSLNPMKYRHFIVYSVRFLRNYKHKAGHLAMKERSLTLTSSGIERLRPEGALSCAGRVCRLKEKTLRTERSEGSGGQTRRGAYTKGTEEGGRMVTLPGMARSVPAGPLCFQRAATLLGILGMLDLVSSLLPPRPTVDIKIDGCSWPVVPRAEQ